MKPTEKPHAPDASERSRASASRAARVAPACLRASIAAWALAALAACHGGGAGADGGDPAEGEGGSGGCALKGTWIDSMPSLMAKTARAAPRLFGNRFDARVVVSASCAAEVHLIDWRNTGRCIDLVVAGISVEACDYEPYETGAVVRGTLHPDGDGIAFTAGSSSADLLQMVKLSAVQAKLVLATGGKKWEVVVDRQGPIANAGPDRVARLGSAVQLDGTASRSGKGSLRYRWSLVSAPPGSKASLTDGESAKPSFAPDVEGDYVVGLAVADDADESPLDTATISAVQFATLGLGAPARAGAVDGTNARDGYTLAFQGADELLISVRESLSPAGTRVRVYGPAGAVLSDKSGQNEFLARAKAVGPGEYAVLLEAASGGSGPYTVEARANFFPSASAGPDQSLHDEDGSGSERVRLDAGASKDSDGTLVRYQWFEGTRALAEGAAAEVDLPAGNHALRLVVTDDAGATAEDSLSVSVAQNQAPLAEAGRTVLAAAGPDGTASVLLDGSGSSDLGGIAAWEWREGAQVLGTAPQLSASFALGEHAVTLRVRDTAGASTEDAVLVAVASPLPFEEGFEGGASHWELSGSGWAPSAEAARSGSAGLSDSPRSKLPANADARAALAHAVDLRGAKAPILTFWEKVDLSSSVGNATAVEASRDFGGTWEVVSRRSSTSVEGWALVQLDLSAYAGGAVKLRFRSTTGSFPGDGWRIDDLRVGEVDETLLPYPFADGFEDQPGLWLLGGSDWAIGPDGARSGAKGLSDSPGGALGANADALATMARAIDLRAAQAPVLTFWEKVDLSSSVSNAAAVEASRDFGSTWEVVSRSASGSFGGWTLVQLDLAAFAGGALKLRFRSTSGSFPGDGWRVDDLRVAELDQSFLPYPFADGFESGPDLWLLGGSDWAISAEDAHSGAHCLSDSPGGDLRASADVRATLARAIDLRAAQAPVLTFWEKVDLSSSTSNAAAVEASRDFGGTWEVLSRRTGATLSGWTSSRVDLGAFKGGALKLRLRSTTGSFPGDGWRIDDLRVGEEP